MCQEISQNATGHHESLKSHGHMCRLQHMVVETQKYSRCTILNPEGSKRHFCKIPDVSKTSYANYHLPPHPSPPINSHREVNHQFQPLPLYLPSFTSHTENQVRSMEWGGVLAGWHTPEEKPQLPSVIHTENEMQRGHRSTSKLSLLHQDY